MPRAARMLLQEEPAVYHVMSRTALDGFVLKEQEKDYLVGLIKHLSYIYFAEILGYCIMGSHFHLVVRMNPGDIFTDQDIVSRHQRYYGRTSKLLPGQIPFFRQKWANLSEFLKEIKQSFSRYYNRLHDRRGYFWGERFKSVIVQDGETLINCLAYVELNPVRAGLVKEPEAYRWCSLGFHIQAKNQGGWLSLDFGLEEFGVGSPAERLCLYRTFVHEKGGLDHPGAGVRDLSSLERFRFRSRYFSDSAVIGTKSFVNNCYRRFRKPGAQARPKEAIPIDGLPGIYAMQRFPRNT